MKQKAQILIAELDLHKSSPSPGITATVKPTNFGARLTSFCPNPIGERICNTKKSKCNSEQFRNTALHYSYIYII